MASSSSWGLLPSSVWLAFRSSSREPVPTPQCDGVQSQDNGTDDEKDILCSKSPSGCGNVARDGSSQASKWSPTMAEDTESDDEGSNCRDHEVFMFLKYHPIWWLRSSATQGIPPLLPLRPSSGADEIQPDSIKAVTQSDPSAIVVASSTASIFPRETGSLEKLPSDVGYTRRASLPERLFGSLSLFGSKPAVGNSNALTQDLSPSASLAMDPAASQKMEHNEKNEQQPEQQQDRDPSTAATNVLSVDTNSSREGEEGKSGLLAIVVPFEDDSASAAAAATAASLPPWWKRKLGFRSPRFSSDRGEPLLNRELFGEEGGDEIDWHRRQAEEVGLLENHPLNKLRRLNDGSFAVASSRALPDPHSHPRPRLGDWSLQMFGDDNIFAVGRWETHSILSRDGRLRFPSAPLFFASLDQRSDKAAGPGACAVVAAEVARWMLLHRSRADAAELQKEQYAEVEAVLQQGRHQMCSSLHDRTAYEAFQLSLPCRAELDDLIRSGCATWRALCAKEENGRRFPDGHFDLETVLEQLSEQEESPLDERRGKAENAAARGAADDLAGVENLHRDEKVTEEGEQVVEELSPWSLRQRPQQRTEQGEQEGRPLVPSSSLPPNPTMSIDWSRSFVGFFTPRDAVAAVAVAIDVPDQEQQPEVQPEEQAEEEEKQGHQAQQAEQVVQEQHPLHAFLHQSGVLSFDAMWEEVVKGGDGVYVVTWNDHLFVLAVETSAGRCYLLDSLGERLEEGGERGYVLRFDQETYVEEVVELEEADRGREIRKFSLRDEGWVAPGGWGGGGGSLLGRGGKEYDLGSSETEAGQAWVLGEDSGNEGRRPHKEAIDSGGECSGSDIVAEGDSYRSSSSNSSSSRSISSSSGGLSGLNPAGSDSMAASLREGKKAGWLQRRRSDKKMDGEGGDNQREEQQSFTRATSTVHDCEGAGDGGAATCAIPCDDDQVLPAAGGEAAAEQQQPQQQQPQQEKTQEQGNKVQQNLRRWYSMDACREYMKHFLAGIHLKEMEERVKEGKAIPDEWLHQRLQVELHFMRVTPPAVN